ncbi:hypothetical protein [Terracoccus luteus]|uniref:Signal peptidase I n=1 Tax=Terracoccus luteus TaxID=53356 RepID=A0A839PYV9_9MICO|nr:hypothetical protein [Terracoccus luteus]MBB2987205.1 signal peptidase I [Terracoccus luteus]MCP2172856.1 signal peptidase I [Terracoccus luteus]
MAVALVVLTVGAAAAWRLSGGHYAVIVTPSMGEAAPVGTLVLVRAAEVDAVRLGDIVTYRPRNLPDQLVTHRVVSRDDRGDLHVQGDLNGSPDPLPVGQDDLVGVVSACWYGVGWLVRAAPVLVLGWLAIMLLSGRLVRPRWRSTVRVLGTCLLVAVTSLVLRPLVAPVILGVTTSEPAARTTTASVVSAGLLPSRVVGADDRYADVRLGETVALPVVSTAPGSPMTVSASAHLRGWWLLTVTLCCLTPLLWTSTVGLAQDGRSTRG